MSVNYSALFSKEVSSATKHTQEVTKILMNNINYQTTYTKKNNKIYDNILKTVQTRKI